MGLEIEKKGGYTKLKYFGYKNDIQWYIKEHVFPGVSRCVDGELILILPNKPNMVKLFPNGGFLERIGDEFKIIEDKKTIDEIIKTFKK